MILGLSLASETASLDFEQGATIAGVAEQAGLDFLLIPDVAAREVDTAKHEAFALAAALSAVTTRIGLVVTASLDFNDPYNLARALATLDHLAAGRAGWRAVTGASRDEARNFGLDDIVAPAARLARADEMLEVVRGLHDSWDDGAVPRDKPSGLFFDRVGMRPIGHAGAAFQVRGPLDVPTTPQRHLPLFCDFGVAEDRLFAVRHADALIVDHAGLAAARAMLRDRQAARVLSRFAVAPAADPAGVANEMNSCVAAGEADGFIVACPDPAWFVTRVAPKLQRPASAPGATLRTRLGLGPARSRHDPAKETCSA